MLTPHHRENAKLRDVRVPSQNGFDAQILFVSETVSMNKIRRNRTSHAEVIKTDPNIDRSRGKPSSLPSRASQARSGCGIIPTTLRCRLQIPAMLRRLPLGFPAGVGSP